MKGKDNEFDQIVREAWLKYDPTRPIQDIEDISAKVSTNHVYRMRFDDRNIIIAKLSFFGKYEHFVEDHRIINALSNNLPAPFENFLARSLFKKDKLFVYRHRKDAEDIWVVFYRPIRTRMKLPRRLETNQIIKLAEQIALFHKACNQVRATLPESSKSLKSDIHDLLDLIEDPADHLRLSDHRAYIKKECNHFLEHYEIADHQHPPAIPVFVDWNIGNFSVTRSFKFFSRWDYDWFRMSSRVMDFYFFSRVVSDIGDRTIFTYNASTLMEGRFLIFLQKYHETYPLHPYEIDMIPQAYRFFLLNYVIKYGNYFFSEKYAEKLQFEAINVHLPSIDNIIDTNLLKSNLNIS